ncbi:hypothetical protein CYMTET_21283 [Cymbomonas tetramitiformis]|uniref:LysM domain-containing protein n=1 Tax=Cymbomonas tetramitiformis TaxID=36881 RepID=A0AAE0G2B9_9CHLO|nr:hypothetical protein CYMTET_21283 [Cymbomonas tetramitiformis]
MHAPAVNRGTHKFRADLKARYRVATGFRNHVRNLPKVNVAVKKSAGRQRMCRLGVYAETTYTVKDGDTLFKIAYANDMTVKELIRINGLQTKEISVGQQLIVPGLPARASPVSPATPVYVPILLSTSDEGAEMSSRMTPEQSFNPIQQPVAAVSSPGVPYVVKDGDSLFSIATAHNVNIKSLLSANELYGERRQIRIGQQLIIPRPDESAIAPKPAAPIADNVLPTASTSSTPPPPPKNCASLPTSSIALSAHRVQVPSSTYPQPSPQPSETWLSAYPPVLPAVEAVTGKSDANFTTVVVFCGLTLAVLAGIQLANRLGRERVRPRPLMGRKKLQVQVPMVDTLKAKAMAR